MAYCLQLPPGTTNHNVFHVSQLEKNIGGWQVIHPSLPELPDDFEMNVRNGFGKTMGFENEKRSFD